VGVGVSVGGTGVSVGVGVGVSVGAAQLLENDKVAPSGLASVTVRLEPKWSGDPNATYAGE